MDLNLNEKIYNGLLGFGKFHTKKSQKVIDTLDSSKISNFSKKSL